MNKEREHDSFRTSTDIYGGVDADYETHFFTDDGMQPVYGPDGGAAEKTEAEEPPKRRRKKKRRKKHYMLRLILILIAAAAIFLILRSPLFDISYIRVEGNSLLSDEEIIEMAGVAEGDNMFSVSSRKVRNTLEENAYIASAEIDRQIPDTYVIKIEENKPTLAIKFQENYVILDEDGTAIDYSENSQTATILSGISITEYEIGRIPTLQEGCDLSAVLAMLRDVNDSGLYFKRMEMVTSTSVKANITDTLLCQGECADIAENVESIKAAVYDLGQKGVSRGVIYISGDGYAAFNPVI